MPIWLYFPKDRLPVQSTGYLTFYDKMPACLCRILFSLVRDGRTRHGADPNPVLLGDLAGTIILESGGGTAQEQPGD